MLELSEWLALGLVACSAAWVLVCFGLYVIADKTGSESLMRLERRVETLMRKPGDAVVFALELVVGVIALVVLGFVALLPIIGATALFWHFRR